VSGGPEGEQSVAAGAACGAGCRAGVEGSGDSCMAAGLEFGCSQDLQLEKI